MAKFPYEVKDTSGLTDAVWATINELKSIYETKGLEAYGKRVGELIEADPVRAVKALGALFPDDVREALKDAMAAKGLTREDLEEFKKKAEGRDKIQ